MKKIGTLFLLVLIAFVAFTGCKKETRPAFGGAPKSPFEGLDPVSAGTERLFLENASMAIYRFDLPAGATWGNYNKLTAEFMVDEKNITRYLRSGCVRLLGNYEEDELWYEPGVDDMCVVNLGSDMNFAQRLIHNKEETWESLGAKPNEWFTYTYDISGKTSHPNFDDAWVPEAGATGPFWFALGLTSQDPGTLSGIVSLVRNITLHHATDPSKNVVSKGSGMDVPAFASYYPIDSLREANF